MSRPKGDPLGRGGGQGGLVSPSILKPLQYVLHLGSHLGKPLKLVKSHHVTPKREEDVEKLVPARKLDVPRQPRRLPQRRAVLLQQEAGGFLGFTKK